MLTFFIVFCLVAFISGMTVGAAAVGIAKDNDNHIQPVLPAPKPALTRDEVLVYLQSAQELVDVQPLADQFMEKLPAKQVEWKTVEVEKKNPKNHTCDICEDAQATYRAYRRYGDNKPDYYCNLCYTKNKIYITTYERL